MWFRRDLRCRDNPALLAAAAGGGDGVVPLFVVDPALWEPAGAPRRAYLAASLRALDAQLGGDLHVRRGDPVTQVLVVARTVGATTVHVAADHGPYGRDRDDRVARALAAAGIGLERTGSPYAVAPGRVRKAGGEPFRVFSPFFRAWQAHGWRRPADPPGRVRWLDPGGGSGVPEPPDVGGLRLPPAGEAAALARWRAFRAERLAGYGTDRDRPDLAGTSRLSVHLKYGELHPRTLLATGGTGADTFVRELAWREFYADVLWHRPDSAREHLRPEIGGIADAEPGPAFAAWAHGRTGYPMVDAGMRQLRTEAWVHNRVRMIVASFLVKDLHVDWRVGARFFLSRLVDGDLASNHQGWQWVAGTGTDPAPYFRVFNPVTQGRTYDPEGDYVRRYVPELRGVPGRAVHEPWRLPGGPPAGYPERIVDHGAERAESLRRYEAARAGVR
jgi:deoxyribodipyrimidine photo-lyase